MKPTPSRQPLPLLRRLAARLRQLPKAIQERLEEGSAQINPKAIFVLGNQKSGASAVASLLAEMMGGTATLDFRRENLQPRYRELQAGRLSFGDFVASNRLYFSRTVIREPHLTTFYEQLAAAFPEAQFVFVVRDPRDNIRALLDRFHISGRRTELPADICRAFGPAWELVFDGRWLGLKGADHLEMLAARWNRFADVYLAHRDKMLLVRYEDFVRAKVPTVTALVTQLRRLATHAISHRTETPHQPRNHRHRRRWEEFFGANLARIETLCADRMRHFGYEPTQPPSSSA